MLNKVLLMQLLRFLLNSVIERTHRKMEVNAVSPFVGGKTLSVGCGDGSMESMINKGIVGVEILKYQNPKIPIKIYDGRRLPFEKNSFDTVLIAYVFHHTKNEEQIVGLLKESIRIAKEKVVILEQVYKNQFQLDLLRFFDWITNKPFGVQTSFNFFTVSRWERVFRDLKVKFKSFNVRRPFLSIIFVIYVRQVRFF